LVVPSMGVASWWALTLLARRMLLLVGVLRKLASIWSSSWLGELSHAGGEVGAHEFGGIGEVAAILGEGSAVAVALEGGGAVDGLDAAVVGGVAADYACEVAEHLLRQTLRERGGWWWGGRSKRRVGTAQDFPVSQWPTMIFYF
jgi:hypothetical protein